VLFDDLFLNRRLIYEWRLGSKDDELAIAALWPIKVVQTLVAIVLNEGSIVEQLLSAG